uniref:Uncharacterized protein n=1 Tax=Tanacetum cinerariifolium TaxID=118510 RepID=A0A699J364_TANCI|nr:hypothetical protein [Tanacetum cinerariifolium]
MVKSQMHPYGDSVEEAIRGGGLRWWWLLDGGSGGGLWWSGVDEDDYGGRRMELEVRLWCRRLWWWCMAVEMWWCGGSGSECSGGCGGVIGEGRRVRESDIGDRLDRVMGNIFCFSRKTRRKTFPAAAVGGRRWLAGGGR